MNFTLDYNKICEVYINKDPKGMELVKKTIQAFVFPSKENFKKVLIQAYQDKGVSVSTDIERVLKDTYTMFMETNNFDLAWEKAFKNVPIADGQDNWEIHTVKSGLTFRKVKEGERLDVTGITGEKVTAYVEKRGGAIGWFDEWIRFRKIAAMVDRMELFRNRYWENKADEHYALLVAAIAGNTTAYQGAVADGQLRRDIKTLNRAFYDLGNNTKDSGYGDTANARLVLYADPIFRERIEGAFAATSTALASGGLESSQPILRNVDRNYTFNPAMAGRCLVVLPGNKLQKAELMPPTPFSDFDILSLEYIQSMWAYYGAIVGDTKQVRGITLG